MNLTCEQFRYVLESEEFTARERKIMQHAVQDWKTHGEKREFCLVTYWCLQLDDHPAYIEAGLEELPGSQWLSSACNLLVNRIWPLA